MMRSRFGVAFVVGILLVCGAAIGQAPAVNVTAAKVSALVFEVASVRPASQADRDKVTAIRQSGGIPRVGPHIEGSRAEYNFMSLRALIASAYGVKGYQITGPDWLGAQQYYIVAKLPEGASKDDAPRMLRALLEERFKLAVHRETKEEPVLALVVAKGGPKLKDSPAPAPLDENAPLKPRESMIDGQDGPERISSSGSATSTLNMGTRGVFEQSVNMNTQTAHIDGKGVTMAGFANVLNQLMQMTGMGSRPVVDMTDLKGNYQVSVDVSLMSLLAFVRAQGTNIPEGGGDGTASAPEASDPGGGTTVFKSVEALGLRLEPRKGPVEQLIVDRAERVPTEN